MVRGDVGQGVVLDVLTGNLWCFHTVSLFVFIFLDKEILDL